MTAKRLWASLEMEAYDKYYSWVKGTLDSLEAQGKEKREAPKVDSLSLLPEGLRAALREHPQEMLCALLANKALVRLPENDFEDVVKLFRDHSDALALEARAWERIRRQEASLWGNVTTAIEEFEENNSLTLAEILCWMVLWFEEQRWAEWGEDIESRSAFQEDALSPIYSIFVSCYLSRILKDTKNFERLDFDKFLAVTKQRTNPIAPILQAIQQWHTYYEYVVLLYCFDETFQVREEDGSLRLWQSPEDHMCWYRDGARYEALKSVYLYHFGLNWEMNEKELLSPNNMVSACSLLMQDAFLGEKEKKVYSTLQLWSARRRETYTDELKELKKSLPKGGVWLEGIMGLHILSALKGMEVLPYELHPPETFQNLMSFALQSEKDFTGWLSQLSYMVKTNFEFNRFKQLLFDFSSKPFLQLGESGAYFAPMFFFGATDWMLRAPANWLDYLNRSKNKKLQRDYSSKMEQALYASLKEGLLGLSSIKKSARGKSSLSEHGDVDILLEDPEIRVLIQVKCSAMRLSLEDAYNERFQAERKAVKQLVEGQASFPTDGKKLVKWLVSTSYEGCNQELDQGVRKVSYWDLLVLLRGYQNIEKQISLGELISFMERDFMLEDWPDYVSKWEEYRVEL